MSQTQNSTAPQAVVNALFAALALPLIPRLLPLDGQTKAPIKVRDGGIRWGGLGPVSRGDCEALAGRFPDCGWAVRTGCVGTAGGFLIIADVDVPGKIPMGLDTSPWQVTTSRGFHVYGYGPPIAGRRYQWGDLKAGGAYVVAPGQVHASGAVYEAGPFFGRVDELPQFPLDALDESDGARSLQAPPVEARPQAPETAPETALETIQDGIGPVAGWGRIPAPVRAKVGTRNNTLFQMLLQALALSPERRGDVPATVRLAGYYNRRFERPLAPSEAWKVAIHAVGYARTWEGPTDEYRVRQNERRALGLAIRQANAVTRNAEIAGLRAGGLTIRQIAASIGVSPSTVDRALAGNGSSTANG